MHLDDIPEEFYLVMAQDMLLRHRGDATDEVVRVLSSARRKGWLGLGRRGSNRNGKWGSSRNGRRGSNATKTNTPGGEGHWRTTKRADTDTQWWYIHSQAHGIGTQQKGRHNEEA
jgi:hypothetical protein